MSGRRSACPGCGSAHVRPLSGYGFDLLRCRRCRLAFAAEIPTEDTLRAWYAAYPPQPELTELTALRYRELLDAFAPYRGGGVLVDIGCGEGKFLVAARDAGWEAVGTEYAEQYLDGPAGTVVVRDTHALGDASADVVTMFEVVEHLVDPVGMLREVRRVLRPGGLLYLTTPNFDALSRLVLRGRWRIVEYPEHLLYFNRRSLLRLLAGSGFAPLRTRTTGVSPGALLARGPSDATGAAPPQAYAVDSRVREEMARRGVARRAAAAVNAVLDTTSKGDTLKAWAIATE